MAKSITGKGYGAPDFVKELRPAIYTVSTDKDTQFTDELAKNSIERENISGLRENRVCVVKASVQSDQLLRYGLFLYATSDFEESDIDLDKFVSYIEFNLPLYGIQQTGGQYRMDVNGLEIDYIDESEAKQLHLVLKNLSPTTKNQGSTGEVKFDLIIESKA